MTIHIKTMAAACLFAGSLVAVPYIASAESNPIEQRQEAMKAVGKSMKALAGMAKGEAEFNSEKAFAALNTMKENAMGFEKLFPEGSESGGDTEASPKIFSDRAGFDEKVKAFQTDLASVTEEAPADLDAVKAAMMTVGKNCKSCHEDYRVKKN